MSNKATVVFTVDKAVGNLTDTFVGTNPQLILSQFQNYLASINGGSDAASMSVSIESNANNEATASGSIEGSTVAVNDTATIAGFEFTCIDGKEVTLVTCVADIASSLNNKYFTFFSAGNVTKYYVWYNVDAAGTDPAVTSATGIEVAIAAGATDEDVADATATAITAIASADVTAETDTHEVVIISNLIPGATTNAANGAGGASAGFMYSVANAGADVGADEFQIGASDAETMNNLNDAINASDCGEFVTATLNSLTITFTPDRAGSIGNAITTTATGGLTANQDRLEGGADATFITSASYSYQR